MTKEEKAEEAKMIAQDEVDIRKYMSDLREQYETDLAELREQFDKEMEDLESHLKSLEEDKTKLEE